MGDLRNDIEKYLRGELSASERHALEKRALSDPFLADALEGGESIPVEDFSADVMSLRHRLADRIQSADQKIIPWWTWPMRIAAGLLVVVAATYVVVRISKNDTRGELAQTKQEETNSSPTPQPEAATVDSVESETLVEKTTPASSGETANSRIQSTPVEKPKRHDDLALADRDQVDEEQEKPKPVIAKDAVPPAVIASAPTESAEAEVADDGMMDSIRVASAEKKEDRKSLDLDKELEGRVAGVSVHRSKTHPAKSAPANGADGYISSDKSIVEQRVVTVQGNTKIIKGKVTAAEDGTVLPGVNIAIKGTEIGTITDGDGNFELVVDPAVSGLVFSFIGMESQEITIDDATEVNVAMNPDMTQLSEVVVTGYGLEPEDDIEGRITFASPSGGRAAFKKYIESNLQYPAQALENKVEGRVTIQFTVDTSGGIGNVRVVKGIGFGCDEEVIRLITKGPKWNPMRKDDEPIIGKVKVRVRFKLPKK